MKTYLGIDTSNYTTSLALCDENGTVVHTRKLLPVKNGQLGLRQSDAVFHHVQQLSDLAKEIFAECDVKSIAAVGASVKPRDVEGSYMPCFTVGKMLAQVISSMLKIPFYEFSHQCGHIMAAVNSAERHDILKRPFIAFHVSGGTTEGIFVEPDEQRIIRAALAAKTLDLNAGQIIDRTGLMLGLKFPCGIELERLACGFNGDVKVRPVIKGTDCCLSGVENKAAEMIKNGEPKEKIAYYVLKFVGCTIAQMRDRLTAKYGDIPVLFAGGVMSDILIRKWLGGSENSVFCSSEFAADNAAGIAVLTKKRNENK